MTIIYELSSEFDDLPHATREWRQHEKEYYKCKICQKLNRIKLYPAQIDVAVKEMTSDKAIYMAVWYAKATLFHIQFIEQIRSYMDDYVFGKCYLPDGSLIKEYVTCYKKDFIVIRGTCGTEYYECLECRSVGSIVEGPKYVLRSYLKEKKIHQDSIQHLYIDESVINSIDFSPWPDVVLEPIEVRDEPVDQRRLICDPPNPSWKYVQ